MLGSSIKRITDSFLGFDPVVSPDGRWVAFRKFHPRSHELPVSDEYLLYDLLSTAAQNRAVGISSSEIIEVGTSFYPLTNLPADKVDLTEDEVHYLSSAFWSPDSKELLFTDQYRNKSSLVAVSITENGRKTNVVHPLSKVPPCGEALPYLKNVEFGPRQADMRIVFATFGSSWGDCRPVTLQMHLEDFQAAPVEVLRPAKPRRKSVIAR